MTALYTSKGSMQVLTRTQLGACQGGAMAPTAIDPVAAASFLPYPLEYVLSHDPPQFPVPSRKR